MALLLEVDPIALVRGGTRGADGFSLAQHVNDRPYAAGSLLAVALGKLFRTAMAGRCEARPDLVDRPLRSRCTCPRCRAAAGPSSVAACWSRSAGTCVRRPSRPLAARRREAVVAALKAEQAARIVDVGCGEGALLRELVADPAFTAVVGVDVSARALERAERRLQPDRMPDSQRARLQLLQSSVTYRDDRLAGYDALVLMEVVEHVDPERLPALERSVFAHARPGVVLVTTPNAEHNVRYADLPSGAMRHRDHRFEWTRAQFRAWAQACADRYGYAVRYEGIGDDDPEVGPPTQLAVCRRGTDRAPA